MRYTRFREYLNRMNRDMRSGRDSRNPYGSRGGYVVNSRRGDRQSGDYGYDRMGDMARNGEYSGSNRDRNYNQPDYEMYGRDSEYGRQSSRDYARRVGYFDYNDDANYDMARDYNYDMARGRDYAEQNYKLTPTEIRKWEKELKKESGSAFTIDQVKQIAQQHGIRFEEFTPELLTVISNMMYSDYKDSVKGDITTFVKMAKDFLEDDDFDGTPEEKAYLYYTAIVCKEDE